MINEKLLTDLTSQVEAHSLEVHQDDEFHPECERCVKFAMQLIYACGTTPDQLLASGSLVPKDLIVVNAVKKYLNQLTPPSTPSAWDSGENNES